MCLYSIHIKCKMEICHKGWNFWYEVYDKWQFLEPWRLLWLEVGLVCRRWVCELQLRWEVPSLHLSSLAGFKPKADHIILSKLQLWFISEPTLLTYYVMLYICYPYVSYFRPGVSGLRARCGPKWASMWAQSDRITAQVLQNKWAYF